MEHSCSTYVETKSVNVETKLKNASRNRGNIRSLEKNLFEWLESSFRDFQSIRPMIFSFLVNNSDLFQQGLSAKHLLNQLGGNLVSKPPPNHIAYSGQTEAQNKDQPHSIRRRTWIWNQWQCTGRRWKKCYQQVQSQERGTHS